MAIGLAVQKSTMVYAYNEKGHNLWTIAGELCGFTSSTVSIKVNGMINTYNEKGQIIFSKSAY